MARKEAGNVLGCAMQQVTAPTSILLHKGVHLIWALEQLVQLDPPDQLPVRQGMPSGTDARKQGRQIPLIPAVCDVPPLRQSRADVLQDSGTQGPAAKIAV